MEYTDEDFKQKIISIYPEIPRSGVSLQAEFDADRDSWILTFTRGDRQRHAFVHRGDADVCMTGGFCVYLWGLVYQYLTDLGSGR
jgi:hypothetical protein